MCSVIYLLTWAYDLSLTCLFSVIVKTFTFNLATIHILFGHLGL